MLLSETFLHTSNKLIVAVIIVLSGKLLLLSESSRAPIIKKHMYSNAVSRQSRTCRIGNRLDYQPLFREMSPAPPRNLSSGKNVDRTQESGENRAYIGNQCFIFGLLLNDFLTINAYYYTAAIVRAL